MELFTKVITEKSPFNLGLGDKTVLLGSCFSDSIGKRMSEAGFDVCINPFGTLYNPLSIASAIARLDSGKPFTQDDCVMMGAGAGLVCSFEHHSSFARAEAADFLDNANAALERSSAFWKASNRVIITLGTARVWMHGGKAVSNCLKRPASEFTRELMSVAGITDVLKEIIGAHPEKKFIFTVSPIRHPGDGTHGNTVSKATLHLALEQLTRVLEKLTCFSGQLAYFPAYEILCDELRDYRFYAEDMLHPGAAAQQIIWERFLETFVPAECLPDIKENEKIYIHSQHRIMHVE